MDYFIINKIQLVDGGIKYTPIGYTTDSEESVSLNTNYENTLEVWLSTNTEGLEAGTTLLSEFFDITPTVYSAAQKTTSVEGMGLNDITGLL